MISRRNFILCGAVALLPLPTDSYDQFLNALRQRLIKLARNGYVVEALAISPPQDGQRMTYGEFLRKQREHRREVFSRLSEGEKSAAWKSRCEWLHSELPRLVQYGRRIECCPVCSHVALTTCRWPEAFSCRCGAVIILDKWLPDDRERGLIRFPVRSWWTEMY